MVKWSVGYYLNKVYSLIFYISGESHQAISMQRFVNVFVWMWMWTFHASFREWTKITHFSYICCSYCNNNRRNQAWNFWCLLMADPYVIAENPNKPNTMYSLHYLSKDENLNKVFKWVTDELIEKGVTCPRAIIYCQTIEQCSLLYAVLKSNIGERNCIDLNNKRMVLLKSCSHALQKQLGKRS